MPAFPQQWMEELHARNDIVDVIGGYVTLAQKSGRFWGLCPFHGEKTASFSVSAEKQLYYCFGCHVGGDIIHFIKSIEKVSYIDAVRHLAERANLSLPDVIDDAAMQKERERRGLFHAINREAALFFLHNLRSADGKTAQEYLKRRGITGKTAQTFGLGYALQDGKSLYHHLQGKGYQERDLIAVGLIKENHGRRYDAFRDRLIFPIIGHNKQVIGFGGRILGDGQPKYLNSPESVIFQKRRQLYGVNLLRGKTLQEVFLVEGYMDVISLHQANVLGAVATLGTALTPAQARLLKMYAPKVFLAYDGDEAGQNANAKGLDILRKEGLEVFVLQFPAGQDPDDFVREHGKKGVDALCEQALSLNAYKLERMRKQHDLSTVHGREAYAKAGSNFIHTLSPVEQELYYAQLSRATDFSVDTLRSEAQQSEGKTVEADAKRQGSRRNAFQAPAVSIDAKRLRLEQLLIAAAASDAQAMELVEKHVSLFALDAHARFIQIAKEQPGASLSSWMSALNEEEARWIAAASSVTDAEQSPDSVRILLGQLWETDVREQIERLQKEADDPDTLVSRQLECVRKIRKLNDQIDERAE